jgi:hypothetical protein
MIHGPDDKSTTSSFDSLSISSFTWGHVRLMRSSLTLSIDAYQMSIVFCDHDESPVASESLHHLFELVEICLQ